MAHILVVDDDPDILQMVNIFLQVDRHTVATACSGESAWEQYQMAKKMGQPFDLLILDLAMPFINGYEVAQRIRDAGDDQTRIAFLTAYSLQHREPEHRKRSEELKACGLWRKPISMRILLGNVRRCLLR
jgi:two-component system response regulator VanR